MWASWSTHTAGCSAWQLTRTSGSPSTPPPLSRFTLGKGAMRWDDWWWRTLENTLAHFFGNTIFSGHFDEVQELISSWKNWLKGPRTLSICLFAGAASHFCNRRWCLPEYGQPRWAFNLEKDQFHDVFSQERTSQFLWLGSQELARLKTLKRFEMSKTLKLSNPQSVQKKDKSHC